MVEERYAIYYAPDADGGMWQRASAWLGRDAATGEKRTQPTDHGLTPERFDQLTADPRHYGFHATLKAPFTLAAGKSQDELIAAAHAFAEARSAFDAPLSPQYLGNFLAFRPNAPSPGIQALHEDAVRQFEPFRAPPTEADIERRHRSGLDPRQECLLREWGYPHIFENFRFHMTLSGRVSDTDERARMLDAARAWFAEDCGLHRFSAISLFHQPDRKSPFTIIAHCPFGAGDGEKPA
ncbi:MAG: DUF1045 domain-containing protein [Sphingomonadaceae bacterium]